MEEFDILFLNVHRRYLNHSAKFGGFLGIYLLSAFVRQEGFNAKSFSGTLEEGLNHLEKNSTSMVGLYCDFDNVTENKFLCRYIKEKYKLPVIIGGPQATALDENFFKDSKCDAVVRYEGELTVLELMNYFLEEVGELKNILGISYFENGKILKNPERPLIKNLDALPFADENCYLIPQNFYRSLSLMTGRGCPFHCAFCHEGAHTRTVRFRSVENVLAEIDQYLKKIGDENFFIFFTDDTLNVERVKKICEELKKRRKQKNFEWFCEGHIHTMYKNPEMIKYLADGGCIRMQLGIEAGTEKVLKAYGKNSTPQEIIEVVKKCRDAGIREIYGNIILAGANFSREIFEEDKKFALELLEIGEGTVELGVVTYWPLAETKMTNQSKDFGIKICDAEFLTSVGDFPQVETEELNRLKIAEMQTELEKEIFAKMKEMLLKRKIPTERILSWFPPEKSSMQRYGSWFGLLTQEKILYPYYEMLKLKEGFESKDIENIAEAHPLRVVSLYKNIKRVNENEIEISGEIFSREEFEIIMLTTGKLSVAEICERLNLKIDEVMKTLNRLEKNFLTVYSKH